MSISSDFLLFKVVWLFN